MRRRKRRVKLTSKVTTKVMKTTKGKGESSNFQFKIFLVLSLTHSNYIGYLKSRIIVN